MIKFDEFGYFSPPSENYFLFSEICYSTKIAILLVLLFVSNMTIYYFIEIFVIGFINNYTNTYFFNL